MFPKYVLLSICAFIRVHFGRPGKFSQHSPFRCIHILSKTSYDQQIFSKKSWKSSLFKSMPVFQLDNLFSLFPPFSLLAFFFFLICSLFLYSPSSFPFVLFSISFSFLFYFYFYHDFFVYFTYILLDDVPKRRTLHGSRISNIIDSNDI